MLPNIKRMLDASIKHPATVHYQRQEAKAIAELINKYRLRYYLDVGSFHGNLAKEVLANSGGIKQAVLMDALADYVEYSKWVVFDKRAKFMAAALIPENRPKGRKFILPNESPSGAGFADTCKLAGTEIDVQELTPSELFSVCHFDLRRTFMKIDLEHEDLPVVMSMSASLKESDWPKGLSFEVLDIADYNNCVIPALEWMGYPAPVLPVPGAKHRYYSVAGIRKTDTCCVFGFEGGSFEIYDYEQSYTPRNAMSTIPWRDPRLRRPV
jgi:hypothetical protein